MGNRTFNHRLRLALVIHRVVATATRIQAGFARVLACGDLLVNPTWLKTIVRRRRT